jgi:hypothetical protein
MGGFNMNAVRRLALASAITLVVCGGNAAAAQQRAGASAKQLQGHWSLVSINNEEEGKKVEPFGPNPKGLFIFDRSGRYSFQIFRADLPKFASNNRATGTAEENKAVVQGTLTHFGTYKVNEKDGSFTVYPQGSSYPNWTGVEQPARKFAITGDELKITNPAGSRGGTSYLTFKRAK